MAIASEQRVFAFEGLDGSGKTTVGQIVASEIGASYYYCTQDNPLARYRHAFDNAPTTVRFFYYTGLSMASYRAVERLKRAGDVIYDRSPASTVTYHRAYGLHPAITNMFPKFLLNQLDQLIYFKVSEEERERRLADRANGGLTVNASDLKCAQLAAAIEREYLSLMPERTVVIDTDGRNPGQVAAEVIACLYGYIS